MAMGSVVGRVYTSDAEIPISNAAVSIIKKGENGENNLLAFRLTDLDGLTGALAAETPAAEESQSNVPGAEPFETVDIMAEQVGYDRILVKNVQIFPYVETRQNFQMIPTAFLPDAYDRTEIFRITAQNL